MSKMGAQAQRIKRVVSIDDRSGVEVITSTCSLGHTSVAVNKGMGWAFLAAWESRHRQHEDDSGQ